MNYELLLMAFLLVFTLGCGLRALLSPWGRNIRRFAAILLAFLACFILQVCGAFASIGSMVEGLLTAEGNLAALFAASPYLAALLRGVITAFSSAVLLPLVFLLFYFLFRVILRLCIGHLLNRLLDGETENLGFMALRRGTSLVIGAVGGLLISAILLTPLFYFTPYVSSFMKAARTEEAIDAPLWRQMEVLDEELVRPLEDSAAMGVYRTLGLSGLLCNTVSMGSQVEVEGHTIQADKTLHTLLEHGPRILIHLSHEAESDLPLSESMTALAADEAAVNTIADLLRHEAVALSQGRDGLFLKQTAEDEGGAMLNQLTAPFATATPEQVRREFSGLLQACGDLCTQNFFHEVSALFSASEGTEDGNINAALMDNLYLAGRMMDALHRANNESLLIDAIFDFLLQNEDLRTIVTEEMLTDLKVSVANGETTYESFTRFMQSMLDLVSGVAGQEV